METTLDLLARALTVKSAPEWAAQLHVHRNALHTAKSSGHLTPVLAGGLAVELQEDPTKWITLAVLEGQKPSPAKDHLVRKLKTMRTW